MRNGALFEGWSSSPIGKHTVRWSAIALRAAKQTRQNKGSAPTKARWHGYDWDGAWAYALTLRAEDKWVWAQHKRDRKQPLPAVSKRVVDKIVQWFASHGSVPNIGDIRRNIVVPLYAGRIKRVRRKR